MRTTQRLLAAISLVVLVGSAYGQTPADVNAASRIEKNCNVGQDAKVKQECLKVAKQMEHEAATGAHPPSTYADSRNPAAPNTVMHSSPVMDTPEEVKEEKQARKEAEADSAKAKAKAKENQRSPDTKPSSDSPQTKPNSDK
jgi:hypothetical protein